MDMLGNQCSLFFAIKSNDDQDIHVTDSKMQCALHITMLMMTTQQH